MSITPRPILHGSNISPYVRKVRVALAYKAVEYDDVQQIPFGAHLLKQELPQIFDYLTQCLGEDEFMVGGAFSIADPLRQLRHRRREGGRRALAPGRGLCRASSLSTVLRPDRRE